MALITAAMSVQRAVLAALLLREVKTRFGRHRLGYLWAVLEAVANVAALMILFSLIGRLAPSGLDFPVFLMTGVVPWLLFTSTIQRAMRAIDANRGLLVYPRVKPFDLVVARGLLETATYWVVFAILAMLAAAAGYQGWPDRPLVVLLVLLGVGLLAIGLGAAAAAAATVARTVERIVPLLIRPLYFVSGIFFSVEIIPEPYRSWLLLNPLLHANELMRAGFFAAYQGRYADPGYFLSWILGGLLLGLLMQRAFRRWIAVTA